jgi:carbamoyl-phosphate synthase large subunit
MQSTGEVIGLHTDARVAMAKALAAASLRPPVAGAAGGLALLSIAERDKTLLVPLADALRVAGYSLCATAGTAAALRAARHVVEDVARMDEEAPATRTVIDAIRSGDVTLVVNTPSPESRPMQDAGAIRRAALAEGILCLTSIDTALAAAHALEPQIADALMDVRPLDVWLNGEVPVA